MQPIDWVVAAAYLIAVVLIGTMLGRRQDGASDYFLGRHALPWWAVLVSVVATETSALTVISIPGIGFRGNLTFLQLAIGYLIGRIAVAWLLLPGYFTGKVQTAYELLGTRWGDPARRTASGIFMTTRALATAVRLFAGAIPLSVISGWSYPASILAVGAATVIYTWVGGIRAVVWVDVIQWSVYVIAGIATLFAALHVAPDAIRQAADQGKLQVFSFGLSATNPYAFGTAVIGGAFLSAASHGTDHLIVQRLLTTRGLRDARLALVGSGVVVLAEFALFLLVGAVMWTAYPEGRDLPGDAVFPGFVSTRLAGGLAGLVVAGILAAAMGSTASALNSLASATTHDYYAPITGKTDDRHLLRVGRIATLAWAVLLIGGALLFRGRNTPVVVVALSIASLTYGALLGAFVLARFRRVAQRDAILALISGSVIMAFVVFAGQIATAFGHTPALDALARLAWPWYVPLGLAITVTIGLTSSVVSGRGRAAEPGGGA